MSKDYKDLKKLAEGRLGVKVYDSEGNLKEEVEHVRVEGEGSVKHRKKKKKGKNKDRKKKKKGKNKEWDESWDQRNK